MTNRKTTRRALLMSIVSLMLCCAMLVGTTFAWFTDTASTGINTIQSGNLDIEVYYAYPSDVVDGDIPAEKWKPVKSDEAIFDENALWEPGYTQVVFFKFANEGSLALQYQMNVDILNETLGKTKDGESIQLSNHINAYINNTFDFNYKQFLATVREDATNPAGAPNPYYDTLDVVANMAPCRADNYTENELSLDSWQWLEPAETTYATLVLWMPTTVGNEANHDGENVPSIDLGITVLATQYTYESDSFGKDYDKNAVLFDGTQVCTADGLIEALENGEDVLLLNDIKIDPASMSNAYGKTGINVKNGQTIDGNGNTLDIEGAGGTWDSGINTTGGLIKNITITGSFRGIFVNHNSSHSERVILENVIIDGTTYTISCDQGTNQGLTATNSTFNGWTSYAATIGDVKFVDCEFGYGAGYKFCRPYAPTEFVNCNFCEGFQVDPRAAVTFENCTINGVALTAENLATLVTSNIANATVK